MMCEKISGGTAVAAESSKCADAFVRQQLLILGGVESIGV